MPTATVKYLGGLRTECTHLQSGDSFITDAPTDNNGLGAAFSPTDTVATALASCMITTMGIRADKSGWNIDGTTAEVVKVMAAGPRRISEVHIRLNIVVRDITEAKKEVLEETAVNCPVAKSIHPDIIQRIDIEFQGN